MRKTLSIIRQTVPVAIAVAAMAGLTACSTHYRLDSVERTRVLIDSRYDTALPAEATAFIAPYKHRVDSIMSPVAGRSARYMEASQPESLLSNLLADILVWDAAQYGDPVDLAVYNMGGIRAALPEGDVTLGDLLAIAPFENKLCVVTLSGDKLSELFTQIAATGGEALSHGVELTMTKDFRLLTAKVNGEPVNPARSYRIATNDYVAQGNDGMPAFKSSTDKKMHQAVGKSIRDDITAYFQELAKQGKAADSRIEGRIKVVEDKQ